MPSMAYGLDDGRLCIVAAAHPAASAAFASTLENNLARGVFAETNGSEQIFDLGKA